MSALSNTSLYVYYGNASAADQWDVTGTWNSSHGGVWHLSNGSFADSTANANNGTNTGSTDTTAIIEEGRAFNGSSQNITVADSNGLDETSTFTISAWINPTVNDNNWRTIVSKGPDSASNNYWFGIRQSQLEVYLGTTQYDSSFTLTLNTWSHVSTTFNNATDTLTIYVNGAAVYTNTAATGVPAANTTALYIGRSTLANEWWQGSLDEVRFQHTDESANNVLASYRTQNSPGSYTTLSAEEGPPAITSDGGGATASVTVDENTTAVTTVAASDSGAPPQTLTYTISGGADAALFSVGSSSGVLTFNSGPNFESPTDSNADNVYVVTVQVSDGALTDTQTISVTVQNVNEAPVNSLPTSTFTALNTAKTFSTANGNALQISDVDAGSGTMQFTLTATQGTVMLASTAGLTLTAGSNGSSTFTYTGTLSSINTALGNGVTFTPTNGYRGLAQLTLLTSDLGNSGSGGTLTDSDSLTLHVGALVVTNASDTSNGTTTSINSLIASDGGDGISLREAIAATNATAGADYIHFAIGSGMQTLVVGTTALPTITDAVFIDGWSQPGYSSSPVIELNGNNSGTLKKGLTLGTGSSGSTIRGLTINRFTGSGIEISGSNNHTIQGNWIGLNSTGTAASANGVNGIYALNSTGLLIGGTTAAERNVVSGNAAQGIYFDNTDNSTISGNYVGTNAAGTGDINGTTLVTAQSGVFLTNGSSGNTVGGTTAAARNVLSGNNHYGFEVLFGSQNNLVQGNYIGTDVTGMVALGNVTGGAVFWNSGTGNVLGGSVAGARNVISGNLYYGVDVGNASSGATIQGNYIGLAADGSTVLANVNAGIQVEGNSINTLIGTNADGSNDAGERNVIAGNATGVVITGSSTTGTIVAGNYIGTDATGLLDRGNTFDGVRIESGATGNFIGGSGTARRNIIAGNDQEGIQIDGETTDGNTIQFNWIGLGADGATVIGNSGDGIYITGGADNTVIGGVGLGNVIVGSGVLGIEIDGASTGTVIRGNSIGINAAGTVVNGSGYSGILIENGAANNTIGGTAAGEGNVITDGGRNGLGDNAGITLWSTAGTGNTIVGNSIYGNAGHGIDLHADGITQNDTLDPDTGANNRQNYPTISSATTNGTNVVISGSVNTLASVTGLIIHFYATPSSGNLNRREGRRYLGSTTVNTNGSGNATFTNVSLTAAVTAGEVITATATSPGANGNTSEFSQSIVATLTSGNSAPSASQSVTTNGGGLAINSDGGNNTYLVNNSAGSIFSGRTQLSLEARFSSTNVFIAGDEMSLVSYANSSSDNEVRLSIRRPTTTHSLDLYINGVGVSATGYDAAALLDGNAHTVSVTWDNAAGAYVFYVDGVSVGSGTGLKTGYTTTGSGVLIVGNEQDSVGGSLEARQAFKGTLYDLRVFNDVRTATEVLSGRAATLPYNTSGMVANWLFDDLSPGGVTTESVGGLNLSVQQATGTSFVASTPSLTFRLSENSATGSTVGSIYGTDIDREAKISQLLAADSTLRYSAETGKFYKLSSSSVSFSSALSSATSATLNGVTGQLMTVRSAHEQALAVSFASQMGADVWLGASDSAVEGTWRWLSGSSPSDQFWSGGSSGYAVDGAFRNWSSPLQPDNGGGTQHYLMLYQSDGTWDDKSNGGPNQSIIEWNADDVLDATHALTYSIQSQTVAGAFAINADSGTITVSDSSLLNFESNATHTVTVRVTDDSGATFDKAFTITLDNVTHESSNVVPGSQSTSEDANLIFSTANGNAITVTDVNGATNSLMQVSLSVANGNLTLSQTTGLTFVSGSNGGASFVMNGTESDINAALNGLTFTPNNNYNGSINLQITSSLAASLDGWYTFEGGNANDQSVGTANNGSFVGNSVTITDPTRGTVLALDGSGDSVSIASTFSNPSAVTIGGWVNFNGSGRQELISLHDRVHIALDDGTSGVKGSIQTGAASWQDLTSGRFLAGTGWHHVMYTFDDAANAHNLYIDGELVASATNNNSIYWTGATTTWLGQHPGGTNFLNGRIDDARIYSRALTANEVAALAVNNFTDSDSVAITVNPTNDAPVLDNTGTMTLTTITEDDTANAGNTVATIISSAGGDRITDIDSGAVEGIAVTATTNGNGSWEYSIDGGSNWNSVGTVSGTSALLLRSTDLLRFVPNGLNSTSGDITFRAWDQTGATAGQQGTKVDVSTNGGTTTFSTATETAAITVTAVNDAPTITNAATVTLASTIKNVTSSGTLVSDVLTSATYGDVDTGALRGLAVTGKSGAGTWQYSTDGATWTSFGTVSATSSLLLSSSTQIRYVPDGSTVETATFTFRAWDTTSGSASVNGTPATGNSSVNGGTTAYSAGSATAQMSVLNVNSAPTLDNSKSPTMTTSEDAGAPSGAVGTLISTLVDYASPSGEVDNVTDPDAGPLGIAIVAADTTNGSWFYSTNNGTNWTALGSVSSSAAHLLAADSSTRVYFQANANYNGSVANGLTFHAWDLTSGTNGGTLNLTGAAQTVSDTFNVKSWSNNNGSQNWTTSWLENDSAGAGPAAGNYQIGTSGNLELLAANTSNNLSREANLSGATTATLTYTLTTNSLASGSTILVRMSSNGGSSYTTVATLTPSTTITTYNIDVSAYIASNTRVRFETSVANGGSIDITSLQLGYSTPATGGAYSVSTAIDTVALTITAVNDAPLLDNAGTMTFTTITEDDSTNAGNTVASIISSAGGDRITDIDSGAVEGIAVTATTNGSGSWEYSINGGGSWNSVGTVSGTSALLLRSTDLLRFVPNGQNSTSGDITFHAWDQTTGTQGTKVDVSTNGGTTAFSTATETAAITVTAVNDAPVLDNAGTMTLTTITEDDTANAGNTVATIISSAGGDRITDVDSGAVEGIALTATTNGNGSWEYSINGGGSWNSVGTVFGTSALLLRSTDLLRFVPNGQNATTGDVTFRAWDQTTGTQGTKVDVSTNGGTTAFSTATETAVITVTAVNDAPENTVPGSYNISEDSVPLTLITLSIADVDAAAGSLTVTLTVDVGTLSANTGGGVTVSGSGTASLSLSGALTDLNAFLAGGSVPLWHSPADFNGTVTVTMLTNDNGNTGSGGARTDSDNFFINVAAVNDEQVLATNTGMTVAENSTGNVINNTMLNTTDVDNTNAQLAYTVTSVTTNATLRRSGTAIALNGTFTQADINAGIVTYDHNGSETSSDSFAFSVDDGTGSTSGGTFTITVTPVNDNAPIITSNGGGATAAINVAENSTAVTTVIATDADLPVQTLTYSISGGADAGLFTIDANTGALSFNSGRDRESHTDANTDGVYEVTVRVSDGTNTDTQAISVTITDIDEFDVGAVTDSNATANAVNENASVGAVVSITASASDADATNNAITYTLQNDDGGRFVIASGTGIVTVAGAIDYETEGATRNITVRATSADGSFTDQVFSITINPVNDNDPVITSDGGGASAAIGVAENSTTVTTVIATDADLPSQTLTYSISGTDAAFFTIDGSTGALSFSSAPNFESPADAGADNVYDLTVTASDGAGRSDSQAIAVTVTNVNEAPIATAPANITMMAGAGFTFTGADVLSIADVDAGSNPVRVSLTLVDGTLTLASTTGLTFTTGDGTGDSAMVFTGTVSDINAALNGTTYSNAINHTGAETLSFVVNDLGSSGTGGALQDSTTVAITITTPNNPIVGDGFLQGSVLEIGFGTDGVLGSDANAPVGFNSAGSLLAAESDRDRDGWGTYDGDFIMPGSPEEAWGVHVGGMTYSNSNVSAMQISGSLANFADNGTSQQLDWLGAVSGLDVQQRYLVSDGDLFLDVTVTLTNATGSAMTNVYYYRNVDADNNQSQGAAQNYSTVNAVQSQGHDGSSISYVTATQANGSSLGLMGYGTNSRVAYGGFSNRDPLAIYNGTGGMSLSGTQTSDSAVALAFKIDSLAAGASATLHFRYYFAPAAEPVLDLDANNSSGASGANLSTTFIEQGGPVSIVDSDGTVFDSDSATLTGMTIRITNHLDGVAESLSATAVGGISVSFSGDTLTLSGTDSVANYRQVLRSITYNNTSLNPDMSPRVITFEATDGTNVSQTARTTVTMSATNDAPVLTSSSTVSVNENTTSVQTVTSTDVDGPSATYSITGGSDAGMFAIDSVTGALSFVSGRDRESATDANSDHVYEVIVQVSDGMLTDSQTVFVTVVDVDEFNVGAVSDGNSGSNVIDENAAVGTVVGITANASDADATTSTIAYSLTDDDGGRFTIDSVSGIVTVAGAIDREADGASRNITVRATSADGSFTDQSFTIAINDLDEFDVTALSDLNAAPDMIDEDAFLTTPVGIAAFALDADATNSSVTYSLDDNAGGRFAIDGGTGVVTLAGAIDYETATSHSITVRATSLDGSFQTRAFVIAVNPINDNVPVIVSNGGGATAAVNIVENTTAVTIVAATDADLPAQTVTYTFFGDDAGFFQIDTNTGELTFLSPPDAEDRLDFNSDGVYEITVVAMDGLFSTMQDLSITVTDIDEFNVGAVTDVDAGTNAVDENATVGTIVGITASASDADASTNTITYSLTDNDGGRFAIDSVTGVVTAAGAIDREADGTTRNITVRATSADGSFTDQSFTIAINDIDEFNVGGVTDTDGGSNIVDENATVGTVVNITASASDADATTNVLTYSLPDNVGGRFTIDGVSGIVTVAGAIDRETDGAARNITVRATSADGSFTDQIFTISINDLDEFNVGAVTDADAAINAVDENATVGTIVNITANASDADATTNTIAYSLTDGDGGRFTIDSVSGVVTVAGAIDREADGASRNITVRATSADGSFADQVLSIAINDLDEFDVGPVTDGNNGSDAVAENAANGTLVGITASAIDGDATTNIVTWSLADDAGGRFAIDSVTGVVTVAAALDYEAATSHSIIIRATSADGSTSTQAFTIVVSNVNEGGATPITDSNAAAEFVVENAVAGTVVGFTAVSSDLESVDSISYSLDDSAGGRFAIDAVSGVVTVAGAIDREAAASHDIIVRATSTDGSFVTRTVTITIGDSDEFDVTSPSDSNPAADTVLENVANGTLVGITASAIDGDATTNLVTYSLTDDAGGRFAIDVNTGVVSVANGSLLDNETAASHSITVRATSTDGSFADSTFTISVSNVNEPPTIVRVSLTVAEGATVTLSNSDFAATDVDHGASGLTWSISGLTGGRFERLNSPGTAITNFTQADIDAGQIIFIHDGNEAAPTFTATVTDGSFSTPPVNGTVNFSNTNDAPVASNATFTIPENSAVGTFVGSTGVSDPDAGDTFTWTIIAGNAAGSFLIDATSGALTVANPTRLDFEVSPTFSVTVQVRDAAGATSSAVVTISLTDVNDAPVGTADMYWTWQYSSITVASPGVLVNDSDQDGNTLTASLVSGPANGTLNFNTDGSFSFTPDSDFDGIESFTYQIFDGSALSSPITVTIDVRTAVVGGGGDDGIDSGDDTDGTDDVTDDSGDDSADDGGDDDGADDGSDDSDTTDDDTSDSDDSSAAVSGPGSTASTGSSLDGPDALYTTSPVMEANIGPQSMSDLLLQTLFTETVPDDGREAGSDELSAAVQVTAFDGLLAGFRNGLEPVDAIVSAGLFSLRDINSENRPNGQNLTDLFMSNMAVGSTAVVGTSLTMGYVIWVLRGGSLLAAFVSALPAWQSLDPLPVLQSFERRRQEDDESLLSLVRRRTAGVLKKAAGIPNRAGV